MNKKALIFIIVIIAVIVGLFMINSTLKTKMTDNTSGDTTTQQEYTDAVSAPDQAGGVEVFIEDITLKNPGYVVIHREVDGTPGPIIGSSDLLPAGETKNLIVSLNESVKEGDVLFAMLHSDNGDGTFEFPGPDAPVLDTNGNIVMQKFTILSEGALDVEVKL